MIERLLDVGPVSPALTAMLWAMVFTGTVCGAVIAGCLAAMVVKVVARSAYRLFRAIYIIAGGTALGLERGLDRIRGAARRVQHGVLAAFAGGRDAIHGAVARGAGAVRSVVLAIRRMVWRVLAGMWQRPRRRVAAEIGVTHPVLFLAWVQLRWGRTLLMASPSRCVTVAGLQKMAQEAGGRFMVREDAVIGALPVRRRVAEQDIVRYVRDGMGRGALVAFATVHWFSQQTVTEALQDLVRRQAEMVTARIEQRKVAARRSAEIAAANRAKVLKAKSAQQEAEIAVATAKEAVAAKRRQRVARLIALNLEAVTPKVRRTVRRRAKRIVRSA